MIKIIHSADWHIGQRFHDYDRETEHRAFLDWLSECIKEKEVDLLLIAGDVFDNQNPSADSQRLYYSFLRDVTASNPKLQVIIIAGNHDSASRLEAPNPLFETMNINVKGVIRKNEDGEIDYDDLIVPIKDEAYCLAVPYLRQGDYPKSKSYSEGVELLYNNLLDRAEEIAQGKPIIAMGHLYATGAELSKDDRSERVIIGSLESISTNAFSNKLAYTALGHLHRSQRLGGKDNIRYSGSPLPMSFAEVNYNHGVVYVEIDNHETRVEKLDYEDTVRLVSLPKQAMPLEDVLKEIEDLEEGSIDERSPFLEIKVLLDKPEPSLRHRIEEALLNKAYRLTSIKAIYSDSGKYESKIENKKLESINPMDMALDVYSKKFDGGEMPEDLQAMMREIIENAEK